MGRLRAQQPGCEMRDRADVHDRGRTGVWTKGIG